MDERIKKEIEEIGEKKQKANESVKYSTDRIDIVVISLSTGAIALTINIFTNLQPFTSSNLVWFLKFSLLSFTLSIISNLISQITSFYHFKLKIERFDMQIKNLKENKERESKESKSHKDRMSSYNRITDFLNHISTYMLILGIILLLLYFTFKY